MSMSPTTFAVLVWGSSWALYRIAFPEGLLNEKSISETRRVFYQAVGTILVPAVVIVFMYDRSLSTQTMIVGSVVTVGICLDLYWMERRRNDPAGEQPLV